MSATINFYCDFCRKEVTNGSINTEHLAMCKDKKWTNNLKANINGPHICYECLMSALDATKDLKVHC